MPGKSPGGWAECGGIYRCKLSGFSYNDVEICPFVMELVRSINSTLSVGSWNSQVKPGYVIIDVVKSSQSFLLIFLLGCGSQIPSTSSMKRL